MRNGKTASVPAVSYMAAGVAGAALVMTGVASVGAAVAGGGASLAGAGGGLVGGSSAGGTGTLNPSFTEVMGWMQGMAMNGMLSVNYPAVYRKFSKNFAFSVGLVPWTQLQVGIDNFRAATGGNLATDSVELLRKTTLTFPDGSTDMPTSSKVTFERLMILAARQLDGIETGVTETPPEDAESTIRKAVLGITAYVEELSVPKSNTFMTVLLVVSIVIAAIVVSILLVKFVLELWALFGNFPKPLAGFRKHYWGSIARAVTSLILLLYGVWVLYCVFQFTQGDSWAAKALAGVSLVVFTGVLVFFSWKIWFTARRLKRREGDASGLYENKDIWVRYSLFYESYRKDYWWIFIPTIVYMFTKGCVIAATDGHGMIQTSAQLVVEALMLILLLWVRPFERRSGNIINIAIQVVRVLSVCCILLFVEEFGIAQTTQTITGVVLIAIQSALTGILAILIAWNAINVCCKENPHRKRRKELEKFWWHESDAITPLNGRNSLLLDGKVSDSTAFRVATMPEKSIVVIGEGRNSYPDAYAWQDITSRAPMLGSPYPPPTPSVQPADQSREGLVVSAAPMGHSHVSGSQPTVPSLVYGPYGGYPQAGYSEDRVRAGYKDPYRGF